MALEKFKKNSDKRCINYRKMLLKISQGVTALHIGGSFSCFEILDSLYFYFNRKNKAKIILSKGHAGIAQYILLEKLKIISKKFLLSYCKKNSKLGVHPEIFNPGILASTGSLGHGLAIGAGMAIAEPKKKIYVVVSDGELMEGSVWEAALFISSNKIKNIILIIDNNDLQSATSNKDTHPTLKPLDKKFRSFGWDVRNCNGHNQKQIIDKINKRNKSKPFALIAKTVKGFPISFMSNKPIWHYRSPNKEEFNKANRELNEK
tara:strand:- start:182 stop:967 length:786 start_codon:yes stop_codon:yes gene_type:complete